jgi:APA family basic amino acid/polyamine antiporter
MTPPAAALSRSIGPVRATAMVVGTILGASIFVQPSVISARVPSIAGVFLAWAVAGALTLAGALICAELASAFPRSGGVYVFLKESWGPSLGFLWGWAMFWSMHSGIVAAISVVFARYVGHFTPLGALGMKAVAILAILGLSAINAIGVRQGSAVQTGLTIAKVAAVAGIVIAGLALGSRVPQHFVVDAATGAGSPTASGAAATTGAAAAAGTAPGALPGGVSLGAFVLAVGAGLFAFGGWHMVTYAGDETVAPERTMPRALALGTLIVTGCYLALNAVYLYILPLATVTASTAVAADAANAVLGAGGAHVIAGVVILSTLGALSGIILAGPRVYYAMAQDGLLFRWLGQVHPGFHTPARAILLQALWSSVLVATGTYAQLFGRVIYTEWIFFALMAAGLLRLRRRTGYAPRYIVWGFPVVPVVFVGAAAAVAVRQIVSSPLDSGIGLGLVAAGFPIYFLWTRYARR